MKIFIVALLILNLSIATRLIGSDELQQLFIKAVKNKTTEADLKTIQDVFEIYKPASNAVFNMQYARNSISDIICLICSSVFAVLSYLVHEGNTDEMIIDTSTPLCNIIQVVSYRTCSGVLRLNIPILAYIIKTTPEAAPRTFCSLLFQNAEDPNTCGFNDPRFEWTIDLPEYIPISKDTQYDTISTKSNGSLTIALITDGHIDPLYEPNGVADCSELTCCRKGQTPRSYDYNTDITDSIFRDRIFEVGDDLILDLDLANDIKNLSNSRRITRNSPPAGYWGDYRRCDSPYWAYDDVIETVSKHKDIDIVYYIGDSIDHHIWETTYELIDEVNLHIINKMRKEFGDVLIVPCIGNHESQPTNQFAPSTIKDDKLNTTWLYESLAKKWDFYLTEDAKATLREHGGFSMLVRPGLRVISINNNIAYRFNWWLVYDPLDSKRHLEWLVHELHKAELAGESVHILAHIPPGVHDLIYTWTREYNRVVTRFSSTIKGEFNGHTHSDEYKIFYSTEDGSPINMAWGAGSATSYTFYNVNYKIATFNTTTFKPSNILNYVYNLTEANLTPHRRPHWFQLYDMKNSFGINDLSAATMNDLTYEMVTNKLDTLDLYAAFFSKVSDERVPNCDSNCKINIICRAVLTVLWEREKCDELRELYFSLH
ncbi:sphingomyelin phosphodiesterase 1-like [Nymphalis io]|uniref:sphingomyelin phosphodiesterase 1-like n=1 Tax=Inachis io TaxID=171585 RepID=UPI00216A7518|nr:sphingomyelin phosphodiesterase 1-like [Nymphalis io]